MRRLTEREVILLREAASYSISDICGQYYRLGGYGCIPVRYSYMSYKKLEKLGLVSSAKGYYETTPAGRAALEQQEGRDGRQ